MFRKNKTAKWCIGSLFFLCACVTTLEIDNLLNSTDTHPIQRIEIPDVPFFAQEQYQCGPAALAMIVSWSGQAVTPEVVKPMVYVPERKGSFQLEMIAATRNFNRVPYQLPSGWRSLITEIEAGNPVLVLQNLGFNWFPVWHYAVVKGIDLGNNEIILNSGTTESYVTSLRTFERTWQRADKWAMVVSRPDVVPASAEDIRYLESVAAFEKLGKLNVALQAYLAAVKQWPGQLIAIMGVGNTYYQLHELENAILAYQRAIAINADYAPAHNNLAQIYLELDQLRDAYTHAQIAVKAGGAHITQYRDTLNQVKQQLTNSDAN